jgi:hypothetical protein
VARHLLKCLTRQLKNIFPSQIFDENRLDLLFYVFFVQGKKSVKIQINENREIHFHHSLKERKMSPRIPGKN